MKKWYFDVLVNSFIVPTFMNFAYNVSFKYLDRGLFEMAGPSGFSIIFDKYSNVAKNMQTGFIYHYAFSIVIGLIMFLTLFLFGNHYEYLILFLCIIYIPILNVFIKNTNHL